LTPTLSLAVDARLTLPLTSALAAGLVMLTVGALVSA
jgi:hypothetical protein